MENEANRIANTFHDAGVLTIGFSEDANTSCYDSVMLCDSRKEYPEIIKDLLQTIVTPCLISFDLEDLRTILRDSKYFTVRSTSGNDVKEATEKLGAIFSELELKYVEYLSIHLYFNPNRSTPLAMSEMASLQQLMSKLPETANVLWSVNHDETVVKSAANIPGVRTALVGTMNVYEMVNHTSLILTQEAVRKIEEVYL